MMRYSEKVVDHFNNPRNMGEMLDADGVGMVGNPVCGDVMKIMIKVNRDTEVIEDIKFKTFGCGAAIATSSMVTELIQGKGKTVDNALTISNKMVAEALDGLPPIKMHCSLLAEQGLKAAVEDYHNMNSKLRKIHIKFYTKPGSSLCYCPALFAVLCKNSVILKYYFITLGLRFDRAG